METVKHLEYTLSSDQIFFYRDSVKQEVDLIIKTATAIHAYEFKLTKTPKETMLGGLRAFKVHFPSAKLHLVSLSEKGISTSDVQSIHWSQLIKSFP